MLGRAGLKLWGVLSSQGGRVQQALNTQLLQTFFEGFRSWGFSEFGEKVVPVDWSVIEKGSTKVVAVSARFQKSMRMVAASCSSCRGFEIPFERDVNVVVYDFVCEGEPELLESIVQAFPAESVEHCGWAVVLTILVTDVTSCFALHHV